MNPAIEWLESEEYLAAHRPVPSAYVTHTDTLERTSVGILPGWLEHDGPHVGLAERWLPEGKWILR